ncbi:hypothetical protein CL656_00785 [bacterium]|nr:hypothetical protein [bacterium]|tara:strand:- start:3006 stop:4124 length:1119 start_codon:yes stop_codon:yes gene_type:complete
MIVLKKLFQISFNTLLVSLAFSTLLSNYFSLFTELILGICLILGLVTYVKTDLEFLKRNKIQILYILFILILGILEFTSVKNLIYGIKYEILFLLIFLFFNSFKDIFDYNKSFNYFLNSSFFALGISFFIWAFSNNTFLINLGYRNDWSTFYLGQDQAFCQKLQAKDLCRFQGFLSSPNHYGLHLLFLSYLSKVKSAKIITAFLSLFTFSRSSVLAILSFYGLKFKKNLKKWQVALALLILLLLVVYSVKYANLSSNEHIVKFTENLPLVFDNLWFGHGLNFSGPASRVYQTLIPESHFLQVLLNTGLLGFTLFVLSYYDLVKRFWISKKDNAYLLLALLIPMLFLHPLEDSSLSIALFAYLALDDAFLSKE